MAKKYLPDRLPGKYEKRVFVGGNYDLLDMLREQHVKAVKKCGFTPVLAWDCEISNIHDDDLRILHNCRFAVFEVRISGGELMELERARDYKCKTLVVCYKRPGMEDPPAGLSSMVTTAGYPLKYYNSYKELESLIKEFLTAPEKDEHFDYAEKNLGYSYESIRLLGNIRGTSGTFLFEYNGLKIKKPGFVFPETYHRFWTEQGEIKKFTFHNRVPRLTAKWDFAKNTKREKEGWVRFRPALDSDAPKATYALEISYKNAFARTKREMLSKGRRFDEASILCRAATHSLVISVRFSGWPSGLRPRYGILFRGDERNELFNEGIDKFTWNARRRYAELRIVKPALMHTYNIMWEPPR